MGTPWGGSIEGGLSESQFARLLGVSTSTVQRRVRAGLMPKSALRATLTSKTTGRKHRVWRIDPALGPKEWAAGSGKPIKPHLPPPGAPPPDDDEGDLGAPLVAHQQWREARTRRELAKAEAEEMRVAERRGRLVDVARVEAGWAALAAAIRTRLLAVPARLRQRCPHLEPTDLAEVETLIREALEELAANGAAA